MQNDLRKWPRGTPWLEPAYRTMMQQSFDPLKPIPKWAIWKRVRRWFRRRKHRKLTYTEFWNRMAGDIAAATRIPKELLTRDRSTYAENKQKGI